MISWTLSQTWNESLLWRFLMMKTLWSKHPTWAITSSCLPRLSLPHPSSVVLELLSISPASVEKNRQNLWRMSYKYMHIHEYVYLSSWKIMQHFQNLNSSSTNCARLHVWPFWTFLEIFSYFNINKCCICTVFFLITVEAAVTGIIILPCLTCKFNQISKWLKSNVCQSLNAEYQYTTCTM